MILQVEVTTKTPKNIGGKQIWGIKDNQGNWYDFQGGFKPAKGQQLNVRIENVQGDNGKTYKHAHLIEPPPPQQAQQAQPMQVHQPAPVSATGQPGPLNAGNGKIKWEDWELIARAASELAWKLEPEPATSPNDHAPAARLAFVNTTLIAFSNGKLELPTEAGPVSREPGDDGDPYADADAVVPWGKTA